MAGDVGEEAGELLVAVAEVLLAELEPVGGGPLLGEDGGLAEVGAGEPGEHLRELRGEGLAAEGENKGEGTNVVGDLHVKTSVDEVEVIGARDVHRRPELALDEALVHAHVGRVLGAVREDDLPRKREVSKEIHEHTKI